jgi:hypothetical protein
MNLIKIFILFLILQTPFAWAQQNNVKPQAPANVTPVSPVNTGANTPNKGPSTIQDPNQAQGAPKKEKTEQILIDPFSGSASTASIDVNTNPDLANFVDQTLVGIIVGETKRVAIMQSAQGQVNRFKRNDKINSEYKILEIQKDKILVSSLDNNEYEVYFNNVIKPVERKKAAPKKPIKLEQQLENSLDPNVDPLAPKLAPKKQAPVKKTVEPKPSTKKTKKADPAPTSKEEPVTKDNISIQELDEEDLRQMKFNEEEEKRQIKLLEEEEKRQIKLIQEEEEKEFKKSLNKTKKENIKKSNTKKEKEKIEPVDDSYNPDQDLKIIREDSDLDKPQMEKVSDIDVEKIKGKLKK